MREYRLATPLRPRVRGCPPFPISSISSHHPSRNEPRGTLAPSNDPNGPYQGTLSAPPDGYVHSPVGAPNIGEHLCSVAGSRGFEQRISEPWRIAPLKAEGVAKHSSLV